MSSLRLLFLGHTFTTHHASEEIVPLVFEKPLWTLCRYRSSTISLPYPSCCTNLQAEPEIVLQIKNMSEVVAYGIGLDMTRRDYQTFEKHRTGPWGMAKIFDKAAIVSKMTSVNGTNEMERILSNLQLVVVKPDGSSVHADIDSAGLKYTLKQLLEYVKSVAGPSKDCLIWMGGSLVITRLNVGDKMTVQLFNTKDRKKSSVSIRVSEGKGNDQSKCKYLSSRNAIRPEHLALAYNDKKELRDIVKFLKSIGFEDVVVPNKQWIKDGVVWLTRPDYPGEIEINLIPGDFHRSESWMTPKQNTHLALSVSDAQKSRSIAKKLGFHVDEKTYLRNDNIRQVYVRLPNGFFMELNQPLG